MSKLLIVDDEPDVREFAKSFFKKRNVTVFTAGGGHQALEIIGQEQLDLVLLDVRMEEISGIELLRELRVRNINIKVIMVTGVEDEETVIEANQLGVVGYIHKPLVLDELEKIVLAQLK
jgi:DNA-binding response OmpR family regulator